MQKKTAKQSEKLVKSFRKVNKRLCKLVLMPQKLRTNAECDIQINGYTNA